MRCRSRCPAAQPLLIGVVVHRPKDDVDFDERDRLMFNCLRPHVVQAYENACRADQSQKSSRA